MLSMEQCATLACLLDVSVPKPGNVHRGADFEDATFLDFALSAVAIGPSMGRAAEQRLGTTILQAVQATRSVTATNTNLGIILLLAPLAATAGRDDPQAALHELLQGLEAADAVDVFAAIRLANPGGLGTSDQMDVHHSPPTDLLAAMRHAQQRDSIALQYVTDFELIRTTIAPSVAQQCARLGIVDGILDVFLNTLRDCPDSLIVRKCDAAVAHEASSRAARIVDTTEAGSEDRFRAVADFDFWLRSDGHRRNPGTTADLITAGIFLCLLQDQLPLLK